MILRQRYPRSVDTHAHDTIEECTHHRFFFRTHRSPPRALTHSLADGGGGRGRARAREGEREIADTHKKK